jgi:glycogen debranching enzyme GlgX
MLNMQHPRVLQLIMDSLRYWVLEMHVDGFRFDLASTLARELHEVNRLGAFFDIIHQDPVLSQVKLIAEPWDVGPGGYQVGNFPVLWTEWNGKYRDTVRKFWKGEGGTAGELATRLAGSSDLYEDDGRKPYASINFITAHDGFTLQDLVSYDHKHNEANGEGNRDGADDNESWNCGAEGPTDDPNIVTLRERQKRNFIATLMFSEGVPMLFAGDELSHTKNGNNNTYCHDNELAVAELGDRRRPAKKNFLEFVKKCAAIWREQPVLQRRKFFLGRPIRGGDIKDISFFEPGGYEMTDEHWNAGFVKCLGVRPCGRHHQRGGRARRTDRGRHAAAAAQRALGGNPVHAPDDQGRAGVGVDDRHARRLPPAARLPRRGKIPALRSDAGAAPHQHADRDGATDLAHPGGAVATRYQAEAAVDVTPNSMGARAHVFPELKRHGRDAHATAL